MGKVGRLSETEEDRNTHLWKILKGEVTRSKAKSSEPERFPSELVTIYMKDKERNGLQVPPDRKRQ